VAETGGGEPAVEKRDEFRAEGELAVARMPAGGEDDERAFADAGAEDGGMAVVEGGECFELWIGRFDLDVAMLPEAEFGEVAQFGISEGF
jgi:hypothetical protein